MQEIQDLVSSIAIIFSAKVTDASNHPLLHFVSINEAKCIYAGPTFPQIPNQTDSLFLKFTSSRPRLDLLGYSRNQTQRASATCLLHGAIGLY